MSIEPVTIYEDLVQEINRLQRITADHNYISPSDGSFFSYRKLLSDCDKLIGVDAYHGYLVRAMARVLVCDIKEARKDFSRARRISPSREVDFYLCHFLINVGMYSEALRLYKECVDPEFEDFSLRHDIGFYLGAVNTLNSFFKKAADMSLSYKSKLDCKQIAEDSCFLLERGLTDEKIALALDKAGEVARECGIPLDSHRARLHSLDGERIYIIEFLISRPANSVADMTVKLARKMAALDRDPAYHSMHVMFEAQSGD